MVAPPWVIGYHFTRAHYYYEKAPHVYWGATAFALGFRPTRRAGIRMASFGLRATARATVASSRAILGTTLVRGGTTTLGGVAGQAALAVGVPVAVGYGVSYAIAGKEGTSDFTDFLTGGVSPQEYYDAITLKSLR